MGALADGDAAPDFTLPGDRGQPIRLSDFSGSPLVVYFYPKDDTPGCTKEAIGFSELLPSFDSAGVKVLGISPDSVTSHEKFRKKHDIKITLAADEEKTAAEAYGVWVGKSMYGRSYMGVDRSTFLIDKGGRIARIWRKVKVPGHAEEVLAAAKAIA